MVYHPGFGKRSGLLSILMITRSIRTEDTEDQTTAWVAARDQVQSESKALQYYVFTYRNCAPLSERLGLHKSRQQRFRLSVERQEAEHQQRYEIRREEAKQVEAEVKKQREA